MELLGSQLTECEKELTVRTADLVGAHVQLNEEAARVSALEAQVSAMMDTIRERTVQISTMKADHDFECAGLIAEHTRQVTELDAELVASTEELAGVRRQLAVTPLHLATHMHVCQFYWTVV